MNSPGRGAVLAVLWGVVVLGCGKADRRPSDLPQVRVTTQTDWNDWVAFPSHQGGIEEYSAIGVFREEFAVLICGLYQHWPGLDPEESWIEAIDERAGRLLEPEREQLMREPLGRFASARCPGVIAPASVPSSGRLPIPSGILRYRPGLFEPDQCDEPDENMIRYEWTAIGLGCLGLVEDLSDEELRASHEQFLESMGYSPAGFIQTSLALDDSAVSERVFRGILSCARRPGVDSSE